MRARNFIALAILLYVTCGAGWIIWLQKRHGPLERILEWVANFVLAPILITGYIMEKISRK